MTSNQAVALPPFNALQEAMFGALASDLTGVGVFDNVPENQVNPWVTIGEVNGVPDNWLGGFGWLITATCHVWTKSQGFKSALDIAAEIVGIMDHRRTSLNVGAGWYVVSIRFENLQTMRDPDPKIRHVPVQFQVVIHQQEV